MRQAISSAVIHGMNIPADYTFSRTCGLDLSVCGFLYGVMIIIGNNTLHCIRLYNITLIELVVGLAWLYSYFSISTRLGVVKSNLAVWPSLLIH